MNMIVIFLVLLISGCMTVNNIHDLLTDDEFSKKEYYKCSQGLSVDIITKTPDGEFMREYTTYRKASLKGPAVELTEISKAEVFRVMEYYIKEYYAPIKNAGTRP